MANVAKLNKNGGQPEVEFRIGNLQRGDHKIVLFDQNGKNGVVVGKTDNGVPVAVTYQIPKPLANLDKNKLKWNCLIGTDTDKEIDVTITLKVIQDGSVVEGGLIETTKKITALGVINDEVKLELV